MNKFLCTAAAGLLLVGSAGWAQSASTHSSTTHSTTTNGKVVSAKTTAKTASCKNDKGQFIKCSTVTKTSTTATIVKGSDGKCRYTAGPKKGTFVKCP